MTHKMIDNNKEHAQYSEQFNIRLAHFGTHNYKSNITKLKNTVSLKDFGFTSCYLLCDNYTVCLIMPL